MLLSPVLKIICVFEVLPELRKELHNIQTQKNEQERRTREQTHQAKGYDLS